MQDREAPVGRGGMGIVFHGESEMALRRLAGKLEDIFSATGKFDDGQREIGKMRGIGLAAPREEIHRAP